MKIVFSEYLTEYTTYTFSYAVYCIQEKPEEISVIYERGFLPYTGNTAFTGNIFYLARSLRVDLSKFEDTSENRRVNRKIEELRITIIPTEKLLFDTGDPAFISFCTNYAEERFLGGTMDDQRVRYVIGRDTLTHIFTFRSEAQIFGYVFTLLNHDILHYWYAFFNIAYLKSHSLGKWMMWKTLRWAKEQGLKYVYLGTCYKEKALYKIRDHKGIEFFDGVRWNSDVKLLKYLCKADENGYQKTHDLLKFPPDSQEHGVFSQILT
jgi:hypothetical protein